MVSAMTAVASPTPLNGIRKPSMLMDGMVYRKLITARVGLAARCRSLIRMPAMPPTTIAITMARSEIWMCSRSNPAKKSQRVASRFQVSATMR